MRHDASPLALLALLQLAPSAGQTQEEAQTQEQPPDEAPEPAAGAPVRCVRVSAIDRIEVLDDRNMAFHMKNGDLYVNRLDRACRGLDRGRPYSYRASGGRLCSVDVISMIDDRPFDLTAGLSCGLGEFEPIDEESLAILKGEEEAAEITVVPIEVED